VISPSELEALLGKEVGLSRWFQMDQERISLFADVTEDQQFIHVDPERARTTPFGGTIAHGFLTLSMLSAMAEDAVPLVEGLEHSVNYGFDRIRFISPVSAGKRIRGRFELTKIDVNAGEITQTLKVTVEIEDSDKPALVAEWISRHYFS
jgi:acyl dehydratase